MLFHTTVGENLALTLTQPLTAQPLTVRIKRYIKYLALMLTQSFLPRSESGDSDDDEDAGACTCVIQ